jgi:hypothetical protein
VSISAAALRSWFRACALSSLIHWQAIGANTRNADSVYILFCAFKMFKMIERPADCEIRSVIRFFNARNVKPADIHRQICEVYVKMRVCMTELASANTCHSLLQKRQECQILRLQVHISVLEIVIFIETDLEEREWDQAGVREFDTRIFNSVCSGADKGTRVMCAFNSFVEKTRSDDARR